MALDDVVCASEEASEELLALDEALAELEKHDPQIAQLVNLRYFAGLTHQQAAQEQTIFLLHEYMHGRV